MWSFRWGNLLVSSAVEYHFPSTGICPALATWNKGMEFILVWGMHCRTMVSQGRYSWTSKRFFLGSAFCKLFCSNKGAWYGWSISTLNTECRPKHEGMPSYKVFSLICLRILYGPYCKGFIFLYGPLKCSFFRCNQNWSPIQNEWGVWCWWC